MEQRFEAASDVCSDAALRSRWRGVLGPQDIAWCRANQISLTYDPAQIGWVPAKSEQAAKPRLTFRRWRGSDLPVFRHLLDDPGLWRYLPEAYPDPLTDELARNLIAVSELTEHHDVRAIERDGEPVGQVRLAFASYEVSRKEAEISYWIGRRWWGRGIATGAIRRFAALCFSEHSTIEVIVARVHEDNRASAKTLLKSGFSDNGHDIEVPGIRLFRRRRSGDSRG